MKLLFFIGMLLMSQFACAQADSITTNLKQAFTGTWQYKQKYATNTVRITFENGKDYALFTDIGSGEAPVKTLQATLQGNCLVIPAEQHRNDYVELEICKGKLHLKVRRVSWDENGKAIIGNSQFTEQHIFKRVEQPQKIKQ